MKIAILATGSIAGMMARTLTGMGGSVTKYAVASRSMEKARTFAEKWGFQKAYGSYEEMLCDPDVELVYIATPHSAHAECMKLCIAHGKPVLCEKAFTRNAAEAEEVLRLAEEKHVMVTEAIWTRYMPSRKIIADLLASGIIGKVSTLTANLHYPLSGIERMTNPALAGGALLDVGVYTLNFALMFFGSEIERMESSCRKTETGVDEQNTITLYYRDGRMASLTSGMRARSDRKGIIYGEKGYLIVENINDPKAVDVFDTDDRLIQHLNMPEQITGYEYEVTESMEAIRNHQTECASMPHAETIQVMQRMDRLRAAWGVWYPGEKRE